MSGVQLPVLENLSQCITSHPDQLSLAIPPSVGAMSTIAMATATAREENGKLCMTRTDGTLICLSKVLAARNRLSDNVGHMLA